ncbi:UPF0146 family protein [Methanobacterium paludis]|uniref:UPF0146 protein MSWAN_0416 n=1 Tax=Methanobacterium paludis (strain DSM 25820 / JCM 18151 / SWAN1) TaxID=868131 RepID=F6D3P1_METPW|nr:UPF0146 family protein [Methanobacterium paludis]AEG17458.1 protein of unknown function UPF0146 [Methanobacterium paludis]
MWNDFSDYIIKNYNDSSKIVEVGAGSFLEVALNLQRHLKMDITMTDIKPSHECILQDDIGNPDLKIYKDASLIYSIRPPEELHPLIMKLADDVGADLIIKPLSTDFINTDKKMKLINYKKAIFYKMCYDEMAEFKR